MECEEVVIRLWEYLDQELGPEEAKAMQTHLSSCGRCHPAYCCDRAFLQLLARQRVVSAAPAALVISIRALLRL